MKIVKKDILTVDHGVVLHQVNCYGKFNKGLTKSIREKFPKGYQEYLKYVQNKTRRDHPKDPNDTLRKNYLRNIRLAKKALVDKWNKRA